VPSELALRFSEALGKALNLAQVGGIEGEDAVRLPQFRLLNNNGFRLIVTWIGHFVRPTSPP